MKKTGSFLRYISVLLLFVAFQQLQAQVSFTAKTSKKELGLNQRLRVEYVINRQGADNFIKPNFKNFRVVAGPSQSVNQSWINGKTSYTLTYIFMLEPLKKGTLTLPPASISYEGKTIKSNTVTVRVLDEIELPKDPNDPYYISSQNVFIDIYTSKLSPYLGEGIYVEYRLYFTNQVILQDLDYKSLPKNEGFWNQEIKIKETKISTANYRGEPHNMVVLKKAILIPQKTGKRKLEPVEIECVVGVPTGRGDFFGNPITRNIRRTFVSPAKVISVKNLPSVGRPDDFSGAVGQFDFSLTLSKNAIKPNESTTIKAVVSGKGNLKLFSLPEVKTPSELEVFPPEHKERVNSSLGGFVGLKGKISDWYTIVPNSGGKYKVPALSFSYFDPKKEKYVTKKTEDLLLFVEGAGPQKTGNSNISNTVTENPNTVDFSNIAKNFRYIKNRTKLEPIGQSLTSHKYWYYYVLFAPIILMLLILIFIKKVSQNKSDEASLLRKKADKLSKKYLGQAKKNLNNKSNFYQSLEAALHQYIMSRLQIDKANLSQEHIRMILNQKSIDKESIDRLIDLLNTCDMARYTPVSDGSIKEDFEKAKLVIAQIDKQL